MASEVTSEPLPCVIPARCYARHLRAARICADGARSWWARHGFNWSDFVTDGIPGETLLGTGDPFARRVVEIARDEANGRR